MGNSKSNERRNDNNNNNNNNVDRKEEEEGERETTEAADEVDETGPSGKRGYPILMAGLDGVGKTTLIYRLQCGQTVTTVPTLSFERIKIKRTKRYKFYVRDLGSQSMLYHLWPSYYREATGLIFVIDAGASDFELEVNRKLLREMLGDSRLSKKPLLVVLNKIDQSWAKTEATIVKRLGLSDIAADRKWRVISICAVTGEGLRNGNYFEWLHDTIAEDRRWLQRLSLSPRRRNSESKKT